MKLGTKLLAFTVTFLMLFSNCLVGIPVVAAEDGTPGQSGTTLTAVVTMNAANTMTYPWTINKSVDEDFWQLFKGDTAQSTYTIDVTKGEAETKATVSGKVTVTNGGGIATENLAITVVITKRDGNAWVPLGSVNADMTGKTILQPGESYSYPYTYTLDPAPAADTSLKVMANVTITNHSGHLGVPFGPGPDASGTFTSTTTVVNDTIQVEDSFNPKGSPWIFDKTDSVSYTRTFDASAEGDIVNTATIKETKQSSSVTVKIQRYNLSVAKTANTSYTRTYDWTIEKSVDKTMFMLAIGAHDFAYYTVHVTSSYIDSDYKVSGTITVTNPAPFDALLTRVSDILPGSTPSVDVGVNFPYVLKAGTSLTANYTASMTSAANATNTAQAIQQNYLRTVAGDTATGTTTITGTAAVKFGAPTTIIDENADVTDSFAGALGSLSASATTPTPSATYTYSRQVGPYTVRDAYELDNTATVTAADTGTIKTASQSVTVWFYGAVSVAKDVTNVPDDTTNFTVHIEGSGPAAGYSNDVVVNEKNGIVSKTASLSELPLGHYTVTEVYSGTEYAKDGFTIQIGDTTITSNEFDLTDDNWNSAIIIKANNHKLLGDITVTKAVTGGTPKAGDTFTFELYQGTKLIGTESIVWPAKTCKFTGLEYGDYTVKELDATGYTRQAEFIVGAAVKLSGLAAGITCTNDKLFGSLLIHKVSTLDQSPVKGVQFQVSTSKGFEEGTLLTLPNDGMTDKNGDLLVENLEDGLVLYVREIKQAPGYDIDPTVIRNVTIHFSQTARADFANNPVGQVRVIKQDAADSKILLAGAVFGVYSDADCTKLVEKLAATDASGEALSGELPFGAGTVYYVKEITAPAGYQLNTAVQQAKFTKPGDIVELTFTDVKDTGSLVILKVDSLDETKELAGAVFQLYSDEALKTKVGGEVTTGADGLATWTNLTAGNYWLVETAAPEKYDLLTEAIPVTVAAGVTQPDPIVIANQYNPPEDIQTGMMDWNILLLGAFALLSGLLLVVVSRKKARQSR